MIRNLLSRLVSCHSSWRTVRASVHMWTGSRSHVLPETKLRLTLTYPQLEAQHFFFPCRDIEVEVQACSRWHTCTDCVNSNTTVAGFTQNADDSHHFWLRYNNSDCERSAAAACVWDSKGSLLEHSATHTPTCTHTHTCFSLGVPFSPLSLYIGLHVGDLVKVPLQRLRGKLNPVVRVWADSKKEVCVCVGVSQFVWQASTRREVKLSVCLCVWLNAPPDPVCQPWRLMEKHLPLEQEQRRQAKGRDGKTDKKKRANMKWKKTPGDSEFVCKTAKDREREQILVSTSPHHCPGVTGSFGFSTMWLCGAKVFQHNFITFQQLRATVPCDGVLPGRRLCERAELRQKSIILYKPGISWWHSRCQVFFVRVCDILGELKLSSDLSRLFVCLHALDYGSVASVVCGLTDPAVIVCKQAG